MALKIDVISDVVCPWCYIGKRRLSRALELYREQNPLAPAPVVRWHPFQLNPDLPEEGVDRDEYLRRKFGGRADEIYAQVTEVGKSVGIVFAFNAVPRQPQTLAAHSLIQMSAESGDQDSLVEALFKAYFVDGRDLTSREELVAIASSVGLAAARIEACLADGEERERVRNADARARQMGVQGVPFFVFNQRYAVSGAQEPMVLLDAMHRAEEEAKSA